MATERYVAQRGEFSWFVTDTTNNKLVSVHGSGSRGAIDAQQAARRLNSRRPPKPHLVAWRKAHKLTQTALADRLGVEMTTVQRWEAGNVSPPAYLALALERLDQLL